jgi:hypothetical protein
MEDKIYQCSICGTFHHCAIDRAKCEIACTERAEQEAKAAAEAQKKAEQQVRKAEVDLAFEHLHTLMTAYVKDYGHYEYSDGGEDTNFHWPSRLWHSFW